MKMAVYMYIQNMADIYRLLGSDWLLIYRLIEINTAKKESPTTFTMTYHYIMNY
jgi:hypothetical protein